MWVATHNIGRTEKAEMYLKAILMIGQESPPVTVTKVAEFMGVSPASASEMLKRMEQNQLVDTTSGEGIMLTEQGATEARGWFDGCGWPKGSSVTSSICRCSSSTTKRANWSTLSATWSKIAWSKCSAIPIRAPMAFRSRRIEGRWGVPLQRLWIRSNPVTGSG